MTKKRGLFESLFGNSGPFGNRSERNDPDEFGDLEDFLDDEVGMQSLEGLPWPVAVARLSESLKVTIPFPSHVAAVSLSESMVFGEYTIQFIVGPAPKPNYWSLYLLIGDQEGVSENVHRMIVGRLITVARLAALLSELTFIDERTIVVASEMFNNERPVNQETADHFALRADRLAHFMNVYPVGTIEAYLRAPRCRANDVEVQSGVLNGAIELTDDLAKRGIMTTTAYQSAIAPYAEILEAYRLHKQWDAEDQRYALLRFTLSGLGRVAEPGVALTAAWTLTWIENQIPDELMMALKLGARIIPEMGEHTSSIMAQIGNTMDMRYEAMDVAAWYEQRVARPVEGGQVVPMLVADVVDTALNIVKDKLTTLIQ